MNLSEQGLNFIANWEGFRQLPYLDAAGIPTIGFGHVIRPGEDFSKGITREQGLALLKRDASRAEGAIKIWVHVELNQAQYDALVSFVYNIGITAFRKSTLLKFLNAGDFAGAARQFTLWVRAGGKPVLGLVRRRTAEQTLFKTGGYDHG